MKKIIFLLIAILLQFKEAISQCANSITASVGYDPGADKLSLYDSENGFGYASGNYTVYPRNGETNASLANVINPFIIVEGFDVGNNYDCQGIYNRLGALGPQLRSTGFDIIILNLSNPKDYIQRNAFLVMELINQTNQVRSNNQEMTIMGISMGGFLYVMPYLIWKQITFRIKQNYLYHMILLRMEQMFL